MAKLIIKLPNSRDVIHEFSGELVTLGRSADNKVQINHDSVSGHHAKFIFTKGRYRLKDLDSTNKTCINGLPITEAVLTGSCTLRFGTVECVFKEDLAASGENIATQLAEAQRQIAALMRARDALHEQNQLVSKQRDALQISNDDLTDKISDIEAEKNRIAQERDLARKKVEDSGTNSNLQAEQLNAAVRERDSLLQLEKQLRAQIAEVSQRASSSSEEHQKAVQEASNGRKEIESLRAELGALRSAGERSAAQLDDANSRIEELLKKRESQDGVAAAKLSDAAKQVEVLKETNASLSAQLHEAKKLAEQSAKDVDSKTAELEGRVKEAQTLLQTAQAEREAERKTHVRLTIQLADAEHKIERLAGEHEVAIAEAGAKLDETRKQIEALETERQAVVQKTGELDAQLAESKKQASAFRKQQETAAKANEKLASQLDEAKQRVENLLAERDTKLGAVSDELANARKQIEELEKKREESARAAGELETQLSESKKQAEAIRAEKESADKLKEKLAARLEGIRAERDEASQRSKNLEAELSETRKQIDQAVNKGNAETGELAARIEEAQKQIDAMRSEREEAGRANAELASQLESTKKQFEELARSKGAEVDEIACSLGEAQKRIDAITRERDCVKQASDRLAAELDDTKHHFAQQIGEREAEATEKLKTMQEQIASLGGEREALLKRTEELAGALESHREQVAALQAAQQADSKELSSQLAEAKARAEQLSQEHESAIAKADAQLNEARKQIKALETERKEVVQQTGDLNAQLTESREQVVAIREEQEAAVEAKEKLAVQLEEATRKLEELSCQHENQQSEVALKLAESAKRTDALVAELDALKKAGDQTAARMTEAERLVEKASVERDSAKQKNERLEAELSETRKQIDKVAKKGSVETGELAARLDEARKQIKALETEREAVVQNAAELNAQLSESKEQAAAIRSEQEGAAKAKENLAAQLEEAEQKLQVLYREHETQKGEVGAKLVESTKRIDALLAELDALKKAGDQASARITEAERLAEATRAERDTARQESDRLNAELSETRKQIDQVAKNGSVESREIAARLDDAQKQIEAMRSERDEVGRANAELDAQLEATKKQIEELVRNKGAEVDEIACNLGEAQKRIDAITRERDGVKQASDRLAAELEETKEQFSQQIRERESEAAEKLKTMQEQIASLGGEREALLKRTQEMAAALESQATQQAHNKELASQLAEAKARAEKLSQEQESRNKEVANKLTEAQTQIAALSKQKQELAAELSARREKAGAKESASSTAKQTNDNLAKQLDETKQLIKELEQKHATAFAMSAEKFRETKNELEAIRFERSTLQQKIEELCARHEADRQQIASLRAERDEARTAAKRLESGRDDSAPKPKAPSNEEPIVSPLSGTGAGIPLRLATDSTKAESARSNSDFAKRAMQAAASADSSLDHNTKISNDAVRSILPAVPQIVTIIRSSLQYFIRHPDDRKLVEQLHVSSQKITEKTSHIKPHPVHRLAAAIEMMLREFVKFPEQINSGSLKSLSMGLESLATLLDEKNIYRASALPPAHVFAIDDNADVQRELASAVKLVKMNFTCADTPSKALSGLGEKPADLILLDVNLPEMTGFDLCKQVRSLPAHRKTPIVFITGAGTAENRAQSMLTGGNDFIAKPFDFAEMNLKTLSWAFKAQLELT